MKKGIVLFFLTAMFFSGCLVTSFHPFYKPADLVKDNLLPGDWINKNSLLTFSQLEEGYLLNYRDCEDPHNAPNDYSTCTMADFTVRLMKLGESYYMDFFPKSYMNSDNLFLNLHVKSTHSLAKVTITKGQLEFRMLSYAWLTNHLEAGKDKLSHIKTDDLVTLTATTDEIQAFILKHQNEPGFLDDPIVVNRK
ncbi:MAG: hypothetical protein SH857_10895 [Chitinophagales bacterium]|nr:hypothetical protein [Chitinophagales bacterium]